MSLQDIRRIEMSVPVCVGGEKHTPGKLVSRFMNRLDAFAVSSLGEVPKNMFTGEKDNYTMEGIVNFELMSSPAVAKQFAEEQGGYFFDEAKKMHIDEVVRDILGIDAKEDLYQRRVDYSDFIGALKACEGNFHPDYYNSKKLEEIKQDWKERISELESIAGSSVVFTQKKKVLIELKDENWSRDKSYVRIDEGLNRDELDLFWAKAFSYVYVERMNLGVDKKDFLRACNGEILGAVHKYASEKVSDDREIVRVGYDDSLEKFDLHRYNHGAEKFGYPLKEVVDSVRDVKDFLVGVVGKSAEDYKKSLNKRVESLHRRVITSRAIEK